MGRSTVDLYEYDPSWPGLFEAARADLVEACEELVVAVHHLHVISHICRDLDDWLALRDLLRSDPNAAHRSGEQVAGRG